MSNFTFLKSHPACYACVISLVHSAIENDNLYVVVGHKMLLKVAAAACQLAHINTSKVSVLTLNFSSLCK